jgi:hypothetical protein
MPLSRTTRCACGTVNFRGGKVRVWGSGRFPACAATGSMRQQAKQIALRKYLMLFII